ncbi:hypothetical protein Q3G72_021973 [Acer saccharum]|nr:hypothetical protein Q3G72_021973 [Acer saccharum]
MANFNEGMALFASRASRVMEGQVREAKDMRLQEGDIEDEMKRNLQDTQATYEKLLNGFMETSQDRDSLNLSSSGAILRSGRIVNNGRNEETMDESNKTPRERNDEEKGILVREDTEGGKVKILDVEETPKADPSNNKLPSPSFPRVPYPGRLRKDKMEQSFKDIYDVLSKVTINLPLLDAVRT